MYDFDADVQQKQSRDQYIYQHINEAYEQIRDDKADPPIQPEIRLKEGWRNGNIHISTASPTSTDEAHTWDIWLKVASDSSDSWEQVTEIFVRVP